MHWAKNVHFTARTVFYRNFIEFPFDLGNILSVFAHGVSEVVDVAFELGCIVPGNLQRLAQVGCLLNDLFLKFMLFAVVATHLVHRLEVNVQHIVMVEVIKVQVRLPVHAVLHVSIDSAQHNLFLFD